MSSGKTPPRRRDKIALVLAGGGITGGSYEIGALRAIDGLLADRSVTDFDIYVGTSAGSLVCSYLANGFCPQEILDLIDHRHPELGGARVGDILPLTGRACGGRSPACPALSTAMLLMRQPTGAASCSPTWSGN